MVTFVGLVPDHAGVGADTTLNGTWRGCVFDFKDSVFVEAAMAYFFSYRQQAGVSFQDVMDLRPWSHVWPKFGRSLRRYGGKRRVRWGSILKVSGFEPTAVFDVQ